MSEYDQAFDPNILVGHCDLISRFSDFALYLDTPSVYFHTFYVPPPKGWGTYCFWCGSRRRRRSFLSARYLLNHLMDLDQTGTEISLGQPNGVISFR